MLEALPRATFSLLAGSLTLKRLASRYGMRRTGSFARRFIAGEDIADAIEAAHAIERDGLLVTLDLLGESVATSEDAARATRSYIEVIGEVERSGIDRNLSVKLSQLGLDVDRATGIDNLRRLLDAATPGNFFVRVDMESSKYTAHTLDAVETLWGIGYRNVGVVIQSYLRRSKDDVERMNRLGIRVRLVKGAYRESRDVAFHQKTAVDAAFVELMERLLLGGTYPAIATHDPIILDATKKFAAVQGIGQDKFEFQMLYGIRRDLQRKLVAEGWRLRLYVPFGRAWYPYYMRRLAERPANVLFMLRNLFRS